MYITIFIFIYFLISLYMTIGIIKDNPQDFSPIGWKDVFEIIFSFLIFLSISPILAFIIIAQDKFRRWKK